jgi:putative spermidine/putrescine transport system substrate-binding protein
LTAPAANSDNARILWIGPVENIQKREDLWARIASGDRSERF